MIKKLPQITFFLQSLLMLIYLQKTQTSHKNMGAQSDVSKAVIFEVKAQETKTSVKHQSFLQCGAVKFGTKVPKYMALHPARASS
jgi:hypothetical protein